MLHNSSPLKKGAVNKAKAGEAIIVKRNINYDQDFPWHWYRITP